MFISKGCLEAILVNLSVLNREVEELKKAINFEEESKRIAKKPTFRSENHPRNY